MSEQGRAGWGYPGGLSSSFRQTPASPNSSHHGLVWFMLHFQPFPLFSSSLSKCIMGTLDESE